MIKNQFVKANIKATFFKKRFVYKLYYSDTGTSLPSISSFLEDTFETFTGWNAYGDGNISQSSEKAFAGTYSLKKSSNNDPNGGYKLLGLTVERGIAVTGWIYRPSGGSGGTNDCITLEDSSYNGYGINVDHSNNELKIDKRTNATATTVASTPFDPPEDSWYQFKFYINTDGTLDLYIFNTAGVELARLEDINDDTYSTFDRVVIRGGYDYYVDNLEIGYIKVDIREAWEGEVINEPSFRSAINGGPGEIVIQLARKIDSFGEGDDIVLNRKVDIYVYDRDAPQGRLLYQGFIAGYAPILDGAREYIEVTILGYVVEIGQRILKDGAGNTTIEYYSEDPSNIMKDIIEKYKADGGNLDYTDDSIETTGTSVTYKFTCYTIKEALDKLIELTPYDWYWRIDPDGIIYLKQKSSTADHKLYIGKHIIYMKPQKRIESIRNTLYFVGGTPEGQPQLYRKYTRTSSINTWGLREEKWTDQRVTRTDTADIKAERWLNEREEPEVRTVLRVLDNNGENPDLGYDIESIKPGDTISIENLKSSRKELTLWDQMVWDQSNWDFEVSYITADVLHVISTVYHPDYLEIEAAKALPSVPKRIEDIQRNVDAMTTAELPVKPTEA
ncbi:MAG: hypothetical protein ACTSYW_10525 [Candidatus Heimdallarchaeota archaeon]